MKGWGSKSLVKLVMSQAFCPNILRNSIVFNFEPTCQTRCLPGRVKDKGLDLLRPSGLAGATLWLGSYKHVLGLQPSVVILCCISYLEDRNLLN